MKERTAGSTPPAGETERGVVGSGTPPRMQERLYNDMLIPEETRGVREEVRRFAEEKVAPRAREIANAEESVEAFPRDIFDAMGEASLFKIPFGKESGGRGLRYPVLATATVIEELAYFSSSVAAIYDVHCILAGHALDYGSDHIKREYLIPVVEGTKVGSFATTEPEASTDLSPTAMQTVAEKRGDEYVVNGQKRWITNSPVADFVVALCLDGDRMTELVIDLDGEGVRVGEPDKKLGNRGQLTADVYFEDVRVPAENVVGEAGRGLRIALATLTYGRIGIAASGVAMAQSAFDHAAAHLTTRRAFGKRIAEFQHWQFKMAERATEIENARNLYAKAARRMDEEGVEFPEPEAAMAKFYGTQLAGDMARDAVQAFGGYGYMRELAHDGSTYKVEEIYRDAKIAEIYEGTNEIQRWVVARTIFGREVTG